jgi:GT2 family glycosyltransferase
MNKNLPLVSIVIVNYNGKAYIEHCVDSVLKSTYSNIEVIVADNGSTDDSVSWLKKQFGHDRRLNITEIGENRGPAFARNRGVESATGKYIAFLDNDTEPEPNWLEPLVKTMENDPTIGACQCKLLLMKERDKIDYVGDYISNLGFLIQRVPGGETDTGQADSRVEILSAKSAAMFIRADVFNEIGGFDEDYFIYVEETDLGWRTWLKGYRIIFVPESRVYHEFGTSQIILGAKQNHLVKFHGTKNYITTLIKNLGTREVVKIVPIHIILWLGIAGWSFFRGNVREAGWVLKGVWYVLINIKTVLQKRKNIQGWRKVSDKELLRKIMKKRNFSYFYNKLAAVHKIGNAEGFFRHAR